MFNEPVEFSMLGYNLDVLTVLGHVRLQRKLLSLSSESPRIFVHGARHA
jgi:hypothetical protein